VNVFLDTSAVVKIYHTQEDGSKSVIDLLGSGVDRVYVSEIAEVEFRSALWRKVREGEISSQVLSAVVARFMNDSAAYSWVRLSSDIVELSCRLIMKYGKSGLRALDALQFGCAMKVADSGCEYLTFDRLLRTLFLEEGLKVAN
jgi:predicted nucleic acid-binding protein